MTQLFDEQGNVVPVTVFDVTPSVVTQVKSNDKDGYTAVQIGYGDRRPKTVSKAVVGHTKGLDKVFRYLREFQVADSSKFTVGDAVAATQFEPGEKVKAVSTSIGRGFQGVVKRHHFAGSPASHGHKDQERASGSIGAGGVQRTFKGLRMPGQMGNTQITIPNLRVVKVDAEKNELYLRGSVPGGRNSLVMIFQ